MRSLRCSELHPHLGHLDRRISRRALSAAPRRPVSCCVVRIVVKDPEEFEQALREFRRKVQEQGLVREMRRRSHYVPPAEARKIKSLRARRRRTR
ncbi:MAG: 30S ribosomal protein S21 [Chloroflexi bacterium]|nr:MAG: 30S ribosomal protein S21 [Chloroflexota bacterium]TMG23257.1 MAG: 30S ribosomal protein S21 [Chloroflexota bacterium]